jgi:hypothetical protein
VTRDNDADTATHPRRGVPAGAPVNDSSPGIAARVPSMNRSMVGPQHPSETYRRAIDARRVTQYGGGACTILVRRVDNQVELLFHAALNTGASLSDSQALEVADALRTAAQ